MRKRNLLTYVSLSVGLAIAGCVSTSSTSVVTSSNVSSTSASSATSSVSSLAALKAVDTYRTTFSTDPEMFNSVRTNEQPNSMHIANFIDGLVENDTYGRIVPALASSWVHAEDEVTGKQTWTFTIRDTDWVDYQGAVVAPVVADDWVYAVEQALDPQNASEVVYLVWMFVENSEDYYYAVDGWNRGVAGDALVEDDYDGVGGELYEFVSDWYDVGAAGGDKPTLAGLGVGIEAVDNSTLKFTLPKVMNYFPTVLTYSVFFPISRAVVNSLGGWAKYGVISTPSQAPQSLAYNGAFILQEFVPGDKIVYKKNNSYWGAANVGLKSVIHTYVPDDSTAAWARLNYESGKIDGFRVSEQDTAGWEKYVEGPKGLGTAENPASAEAYSTSGSLYGSSYYFGFNYSRPRPLKDTNLSEAEVANFELAIRNVHFRRAFMYALDKGAFNAWWTPSNPNEWTMNTYTINGLAVDSNGKDYVEYVYEEYANKNAITVAEAKALLEPGSASLKNVALAQTEMALAFKELTGTVTFPVKVEFWFTMNQARTPYQQGLVNSISSALSVVKVDGVNKNILTTSTYYTANSNNAFYGHHFSIQAGFGWGPDFGDPMTYLNTFTTDGDLTPNLGLVGDEELLGDYTALVDAADAMNDLEDRFAKFAEAEYKLLFEDAIIIPLMKPYSTGTSVSVTRVKPFTFPRSLYGNSADKYKFVVVYDRTLTRDEVNGFRDAWRQGAE